MILGGYQNDQYLTSKAMVVTFVLNNYVDENKVKMAEEWEKTLLRNILTKLESRPEWKDVRVSYSTEVMSMKIMHFCGEPCSVC
jgi:Niemann-Pick C1 protein